MNYLQIFSDAHKKMEHYDTGCTLTREWRSLNKIIALKIMWKRKKISCDIAIESYFMQTNSL